jgi:hypothetical protein
MSEEFLAQGSYFHRCYRLKDVGEMETIVTQWQKTQERHLSAESSGYHSVLR